MPNTYSRTRKSARKKKNSRKKKDVKSPGNLVLSDSEMEDKTPDKRIVVTKDISPEGMSSVDQKTTCDEDLARDIKSAKDSLSVVDVCSDRRIFDSFIKGMRIK